MAGIVQYIAKFSPRQTEIVEHLRSRIIAGEFPPGAQLPSVNQLEEQFRASDTTVQRAMGYLRDIGYVNTRPREGSFVSEAPPHLCHFGLVYQYHPKSHRWSQFFKAWEAEAAAFAGEQQESGGMRRRFSPYYNAEGPASVEDQQAFLAAVEAHQYAGLIFTGPPYNLMNTPIFSAPDLPRVAVMRWRIAGATVLRLSFESFFEKAIRHLAGRGRRRIAFIFGCLAGQDSSYACSMVEPFLAAHGIECRRYWVQGASVEAFSWARHCTELLMHCSRADRPDGLIITDDNLVAFATEALVDTGVDVPGEMEVVAHCNLGHLTASAVPAVRIGYDVRWMLHTAVDVIDRKRRGEHVPDEIVVEPRFDEQGPVS